MKKAIVIGATSGIGRETAVRLVEEGWEVGVSGRRIEALEAFREEYGERVHIKQMDVTQEDATAGLDALIVEMGAPDLLFYCMSPVWGIRTGNWILIRKSVPCGPIAKAWCVLWHILSTMSENILRRIRLDMRHMWRLLHQSPEQPA